MLHNKQHVNHTDRPKVQDETPNSPLQTDSTDSARTDDVTLAQGVSTSAERHHSMHAENKEPSLFPIGV